MRKDYDLVRDILLKIEASSVTDRMDDHYFVDESTDRDAIAFHLDLLIDAGCIIAKSFARKNAHSSHIVERMHDKGHEYLNTVRDNTVWKETKKSIGSVLSSMSIDIIKGVATDIALKLLGID